MEENPLCVPEAWSPNMKHHPVWDDEAVCAHVHRGSVRAIPPGLVFLPAVVLQWLLQRESTALELGYPSALPVRDTSVKEAPPGRFRGGCLAKRTPRLPSVSS